MPAKPPPPTGLPAASVTRPTLSEKHTDVTILDRLVLGWGLKVRCLDCDHKTVISTDDLLERYWRSADRTTGEFVDRLVCRCGSKRLIASVYTTHPLKGMLADLQQTKADRREAILAELERRRALES